MDPWIYGPEAVIKEAREENTAGCIHTGRQVLLLQMSSSITNVVTSNLADAYTCAAAG